MRLILMIIFLSFLGSCIPQEKSIKTDTIVKAQNTQNITDITRQTPIQELVTPSPWSPVFLRQYPTSQNFIGGEGGQWLQALAIDSLDGNFLVMGTDVGGLYRSTNGGRYWESANFGYNARGTSGMYIDPNNSDRVLAVGANSAEGDFNRRWHGLYLSEDKAASWKFILPLAHQGYRDIRKQIAFDRASNSNGKSNIIYYSSQTDGLFKSINGGSSFEQISTDHSSAYLAVHPENGTLIVASEQGLFRSTDGGQSFALILPGSFQGISFSPNEPNTLLVNSADKIYISRNNGDSFDSLKSPVTMGRINLFDITIHPQDSKRLFVMNQAGDYEWHPYTSVDGGKTWRKGDLQDQSQQNYLPFNGRRGLLAWHPTNPNKMWSFGGDWISSSADGGVNWQWDANGYNGIMIGGLINFNPHHPDAIFFPSQDYNGNFSNNYGKTWQYVDVAGNSWGGHTYGGIALSPNTFVSSYSDSWGGDRYLALSLNGDLKVKRTNIQLQGANVSLVDPQNANNIFVFDHRSNDGGKTWNKMSNCDGVFSYSAGEDQFLIGRNGQDLVVSRDGGDTWELVISMTSEIQDAAYDHQQNKYYIVADDKLYQWDLSTLVEINTPTDQFDNKRITTVAIDPVDPNIVYAGGRKDIYKTDTAVIRSTDGGNSWQILTSIVSPQGSKIDGALEANTMRVHPQTRELWVATICYGVWKYVSPEKDPG